jgi:PAS domain-containing protein
VAHVELSLSERRAPRPAAQPVPPVPGPLGRWAHVVAQADEPCFVVDGCGIIVAISASACAVLGLGDPDQAVGRSLHAGVLHLLDFTAAGGALGDGELDRIPPLQAMSSGRLARLLLRLSQGNETRTVDAVATPLRQGSTVVGSLTFLSEI